MKHLLNVHFVLLIIAFVLTSYCQKDSKWEGQKPIQIVPTTTLPIQKQYRATFDLGDSIFASNEFEGARLNGIARTHDTLITAMITPENTPINASPWYAFKLWAAEPQEISLKLTYLEGSLHRYHPKLSRDGENWEAMDELLITNGPLADAENGKPLPYFITMKLNISPDTLWIAAQELMTSSYNQNWIESLDTLPFVSSMEIGQSREGRPIQLMKIGESDDQNMIMIISRQHPPEVTGYIAMMSFVEKIAENSELAASFRKRFNTYVVPMVNPDGVDLGHWRHNAGGRDLNRDWANVNQPEVAVVQEFMKNKIAESNGKFYFGVDFHSTWEDIYYTISPELEGNMPGLVPHMIENMAQELNLDPNIRPGTPDTTKINSSRYFFFDFSAESLTYEFGDNTPRDLVRKKGAVSAMKLMELLLE